MPCLSENVVAMKMYCHAYSHQYVEYLEVDLKGPEAINQKQDKTFFTFLSSGRN